MGTKNNPGAFDCYENAEPDEPMFVLLARDQSAPHLVRLWAAIRAGDDAEFNQAVRHLSILGGAPGLDNLRNRAKEQEAKSCSDAMIIWHQENR